MIVYNDRVCNRSRSSIDLPGALKSGRGSMDLREWIGEQITPAVMVISSPEIEALCQESNGLSMVDLLRPFGFLQQLSGELALTVLLL